jgi:hypothetical protein
VALGAKADAAASDDTGTFSVISLLKRLLGKFPAQVNGRVSVEVGNFPATQPVSGAVTATGPLTDTELRATAVPVSGTFFPGTQPVSLASLPTLAAGTNNIGDVDVLPPTLTKGTQGATGFSVQNLRDAGRTSVHLTAEAVAGATSEALITLTQSKGLAATSTGTNYTVTAGKTLRLTSLTVSWIATTTTANTARVRIRAAVSGAVTTSSPLQHSFRLAWESATFIANEGKTVEKAWPEGIDIPAGATIGVTHQEAVANGTLDVSLTGYEF